MDHRQHSKSLAVRCPNLVSEWSPRNTTLTPNVITYGSNKKVWWDGDCGHSWQASVKNRVNGAGCPYCSGNCVLKGFNDLESAQPDLCREWAERNSRRPDEVTEHSPGLAYWCCRVCGGEWKARIADRVEGSGCPYCSFAKLISENGKIVDLGKKSADTAIQDKIMRGDFELRKIDSTSQRKMANIQFQVTSMTTKESHCFTTDDNGEYRSETAWIPHSQNTNRGQNGRKGTGDGLWFGLKSDGTPVEVNDEERALPYDTYRIQELPCAANAGKVLYDDTFTVYSDDQIVYLNNIENLDKPELDSQAIGDIDDEVYTQYSIPDEDAVIVDQVSYDNLTKSYLDKDGNIKYYTFRLAGKLVYQDSGEEVKGADGNAVTSEQTFRGYRSLQQCHCRQGVYDYRYTHEQGDWQGSSG